MYLAGPVSYLGLWHVTGARVALFYPSLSDRPVSYVKHKRTDDDSKSTLNPAAVQPVRIPSCYGQLAALCPTQS